MTTANITIRDLQSIAAERELTVTISREGNEIVLDWGSHVERFSDEQEACEHLRAA